MSKVGYRHFVENLVGEGHFVENGVGTLCRKFGRGGTLCRMAGTLSNGGTLCRISFRQSVTLKLFDKVSFDKVTGYPQRYRNLNKHHQGMREAESPSRNLAEIHAVYRKFYCELWGKMRTDNSIP